MNKTELVKSVSEQIDGATKKDIGVIVDTVFETITKELTAGNKVSISNFGSFDVVERAARTGRNPQSGEALEIPASLAVKFKVSSVLKASVNV